MTFLSSCMRNMNWIEASLLEWIACVSTFHSTNTAPSSHRSCTFILHRTIAILIWWWWWRRRNWCSPKDRPIILSPCHAGGIHAYRNTLCFATVTFSNYFQSPNQPQPKSCRKVYYLIFILPFQQQWQQQHSFFYTTRVPISWKTVYSNEKFQVCMNACKMHVIVIPSPSLYT